MCQAQRLSKILACATLRHVRPLRLFAHHRLQHHATHWQACRVSGTWWLALSVSQLASWPTSLLVKLTCHWIWSVVNVDPTTHKAWACICPHTHTHAKNKNVLCMGFVWALAEGTRAVYVCFRRRHSVCWQNSIFNVPNSCCCYFFSLISFRSVTLGLAVIVVVAFAALQSYHLYWVWQRAAAITFIAVAAAVTALPCGCAFTVSAVGSSNKLVSALILMLLLLVFGVWRLWAAKLHCEVLWRIRETFEPIFLGAVSHSFVCDRLQKTQNTKTTANNFA